jgi:hypothetical protein
MSLMFLKQHHFSAQSASYWMAKQHVLLVFTVLCEPLLSVRI